MNNMRAGRGRDTLHPFGPIRGSRAHEQVIEQIAFALRAGFFRVGDRLPHVEELSNLLRVSKPTITEALRLLVENGVLKTQRGPTGGITVVSLAVPGMLLQSIPWAEHLTFGELLEARRTIEMQLALLAGERARETDLKQLEDAVDLLAEAQQEDNRIRSLYADHVFHYTMGRSAGSGVLAHYQDEILGQLVIMLEGYRPPYEDPDQVLASHQETLEALRSRDPARIRQAMDGHLGALEDVARDLGLNERPVGEVARLEQIG